MRFEEDLLVFQYGGHLREEPNESGHGHVDMNSGALLDPGCGFSSRDLFRMVGVGSPSDGYPISCGTLLHITCQIKVKVTTEFNNSGGEFGRLHALEGKRPKDCRFSDHINGFCVAPFG